MQLTCPICHARYSLDAIIQDEAARELLALSGQAGRLWPALVKYLGLFRSEKRALAWDRALRLAREIMELDADPACLETALVETVEALRGKGGKALTNHNYLKRVLESIVARPAEAQRLPVLAAAPEAVSKTARAIGRLEQWKKG